MSAHVLIADDDLDLAEAVAWYLRADGLRVTVVAAAEQALAAMVEDPPHAAVLDLAIAGADGFGQVRRLGRGAVPIMVLVACEAEAERVAKLGLGEDHASKPLGPLELAARIRVLLTRSGVLHETPASLPGLEVRLAERQVLLHGATVPLAPLEFGLLRALMTRPCAALTRAELADALWGDDHYGDLRLVDWHISRLRRKLRQAGLAGQPIVTVRGVGYAFRPHD
jgi:DNA-binding response OmpR family regulator